MLRNPGIRNTSINIKFRPADRHVILNSKEYFHTSQTSPESPSLFYNQQTNDIANQTPGPAQPLQATETPALPMDIIKYISGFINFIELLNFSLINWDSCNYTRAAFGLNIKRSKIRSLVDKGLFFKYHKVIQQISITGIDFAISDTGLRFYNYIIDQCELKSNSITHLSLENCFISKEIFDKIAIPPELIYINLSTNLLPAAVLEKLNKASLQTLIINKIIISAEDVLVIAKFTSLTELDISCNEINNLEKLCPLNKLQNLNVSHTKLKLSTLPTTNLSELIILNLTGNFIQDTDLAELNRLQKLKELILNNNSISENGIAKLILPCLGVLLLRKNKIQNLINANLGGLPNLELLDLSGNVNIKTHEIKAALPKKIQLLLESNSFEFRYRPGQRRL